MMKYQFSSLYERTKITYQVYQEMYKEYWQLQAINKHCLARNLLVSEAVQIMILTISDGAIGYAVKYIDVIHKWALLSEDTTISMDVFSTKIFPFGFPDFKSSPE